MNDSVVVLRIDAHGIEHAKKVISCVRQKAGWTGDFLILVHEIPTAKLSWFRDSGIYIKKCNPLFGVGMWWPMTTSKLYIFSFFIKKWKHVIYLDTDVIVTASLDSLKNITGYAAAADIDEQPLKHQLYLRNSKEQRIFKHVEKRLKTKLRISRASFNTGIFAFDTSIITKNTFKEIVSLLRIAKPICRMGEQTIQNLYFYSRWKKLPRVFNVVPGLYMNEYKMMKESLKAIIFHFAGYQFPTDKPWHPDNPYYNQWRNCSGSSDSWSGSSVKIYSVYLSLRRILGMPFSRRVDNFREFFVLHVPECKGYIKEKLPTF